MKKIEKIGNCSISEGNVKNFFGISIVKNGKIIERLSAIGSFVKGIWGQMNPFYCSRSGASWACNLMLAYGYKAIKDLQPNEIEIPEKEECFSCNGYLYHICRSDNGQVGIKMIGDGWIQESVEHNVQYIDETGKEKEVFINVPETLWKEMSRRTKMFLAMHNCKENKPLEVKTFEAYGRNPLFRFMGNRIMVSENGEYFLTCGGYAVKKLGNEKDALMFSLKYLKASGTIGKFHFFQKNPGCEEGNWVFVLCERGEDYEVYVDENSDRPEEDIWRECRAGIIRKLAQTRTSSIEEIRRLLDREGTMAIDDSLAAGNCLPGTKDFMERFGLKEPVSFKILRQHPRFEEMLKIAAFRKVVAYVIEKMELDGAVLEEGFVKPLRVAGRKVRVKRMVADETDETGEETESVVTSE